MPARKTRQYVAAAVESLTLAIELFNRPSPAGREHATVMMAAHAFEMLLKAAIYEERRRVQFSGSDRSFDLGKCVSVAETSLGIIDAGDRVVLLALKEDRDAATHDVISMSDDVLWLHLRSAVTIFRKALLGLTGQDLTDVLSRHQGLAVIYALGLRSDPKCYREKRTANGHVQFQGLSNIALERAKKALAEGLDVAKAVADYNTHVANRSKTASRSSRG